jgi:N-ethylmaleimide reductase
VNQIDPRVFGPISVGPNLELANRTVMLGLTRARAEIDGTPSRLMVDHYAQRATAGLIISEACAVSATGRPFLNGPGMYTQEHALGWSAVTDAVHAAGGKMFLQINHSGRVNNLQHLPRPVQPIAPSAVQIPRRSRNITVNIPRVTPYIVPRAISAREVELIVGEFQRATQLAVWAGFDGVEVHADSGYLIHQFLSTNVNLRDDEYGGTPEKRSRFALEVLDAVIAVNGPEFVSIKFTPRSPVQDIVELDAVEKYAYLVEEVGKRGDLAFMHLFFAGLMNDDIFPMMAGTYQGRILAEGSLTLPDYNLLLQQGRTDLVGFGRAFIANPDLVLRLENNLPLSWPDADTIYTAGPEGYTDYPRWSWDDPEASVVLPEDLSDSMLLSKQ